MNALFTPRFTADTTNLESDYPFHTDFIFDHEEIIKTSSTTRVSDIVTQTNKIFNNSYPSDLTEEAECKWMAMIMM